MKKIRSAVVAVSVLFSLVSFQTARAENLCTVAASALNGFGQCIIDPDKVSFTLVQIHFCETFPNWESGFDNCTSAGIEPAALSLSTGDSATLSSATKPASGSYKYVVEIYGTDTGLQADIEWNEDSWIRLDDPTDPAKGGKYCWTEAERDQCGPSMGVSEMKIITRTGYSGNDHCPVAQIGGPLGGRFYCANNAGDSAIDAELNETDYEAGGFRSTLIAAEGSLTSLSRSSAPGNETYTVNIYFKETPVVITETTNTLTYDVQITQSAFTNYTKQNQYDPTNPAVSAWLYDNPNNENVLNAIGSVGLNITITPN